MHCNGSRKVVSVAEDIIPSDQAGRAVVASGKGVVVVVGVEEEGLSARGYQSIPSSFLPPSILASVTFFLSSSRDVLLPELWQPG